MRTLTCSVLTAWAVGATACGRSELEPFSVTDHSVADARATDSAVDSETADAAGDSFVDEPRPDAPCRWAFAPQVTYAVDDYPFGIAIGDFNGDGVSDILTVGEHVSLWINRGDGTFGRPVASAAGSLPSGMAVGDYDGDGSLDLAIIDDPQAKGVSKAVSVFLNRGDGKFAPAAMYATDGGAYGITAGDFNGDGRLDLALIDGDIRYVSILINQGGGAFGPPVTYEGDPAAGYITASDFNRDGALDIAVAGSFSVSVLLNRGGGTFSPPVTYENSMACDDVGPVTAGDVNGDGYPEILRSCWQGADAVAVRLNNGDGTFGSETTYASGSWPLGLVAGDFFGSGRNDLAVANTGNDSISVLPNAGDGTYGSQVTYAATTPQSIAAGDLNGDRHADLATVGGSPVNVAAGGHVSVFLSICE
jgi:hypothetical protein